MRDVLRPELIVDDMSATEKLPAIRELAELLERNGFINDLEKYLTAVIKREEEFTTGLGMGIAIPHGKSDAVNEPAVCLGRSKSGVDYASEDGEPVFLLFLIAVPMDSHNEHLEILANISRKIVHESVRKALVAAKTIEEIYDALT
jgi:PTS system nitrogen regulatory IIA component